MMAGKGRIVSVMPCAPNPANALTGRQIEWFGAAPEVPLRVQEEQARTLLTRNDSPDISYEWSINPYRGCAHGCTYCYARRTHEYFELGAGADFERVLFVKVNAPALLAGELRRANWERAEIAFSGVTDCYQPLEAAYRLTRGCLEVCRAVANPVEIVTKSPLVLQDADLLAELNRVAGAAVHFSIAFANDDVARALEQGAPPPAARFAAMRRLHEAGVPVGLILAPVIPGLNDRDIPELLERAAESGAVVANYAPLRLPGSVAEVFFTRLHAAMPEVAGRVEARVRDLRDGRLNDPRFGHRMTGRGAYWQSVTRLFETVATRLGLDGGQPWRKPACKPAGRGPRQLDLF